MGVEATVQTEIEGQISALSKEEHAKFEKTLIDNLEYRRWCEVNNLSYSDPDMPKARKITYEEMYMGRQPLQNLL